MESSVNSLANIKRTVNGSAFGLGCVLAARVGRHMGPSLCPWATPFLSCASAHIIPSLE